MQWDSNLQSKDSYTFILNIFSACTRTCRPIILMTILHNFTAISGQFSCPKCTRLACISRFYWHRVHNAPTLCRCAGKLWVPSFWCNSIRVLEIFFWVSVIQSFWLTLKDPVQTCQSGQKLVSPNVITFDVNIELQTDEILWYVCNIKQNSKNLITVEIRTWIRDFSWLFEINRLNIGLKTRKLTQSERAPLGACQFDLDLWPFDPKIYRCLPFFILHLCMKYEVSRSNTFWVIALQRKCGQTDGRTDRQTDGRTKWLL